MFTKAQSTEVNIPPRSNIEPIDLPTIFYTYICTYIGTVKSGRYRIILTSLPYYMYLIVITVCYMHE